MSNTNIQLFKLIECEQLWVLHITRDISKLNGLENVTKFASNIDPFVHNVRNLQNIHVWPFFSIMHESVKRVWGN